MRPSQILGLLVAVALVGAVAADWIGWQPPPCTFKRWTGQPCVFCGGSRAVRSLAGIDPVGALAWNPLVTLTPLVALFWIGWEQVRSRSKLASAHEPPEAGTPSAGFAKHAANLSTDCTLSTHAREPARRSALAAWLVLAAANWVYLLCVGR